MNKFIVDEKEAFYNFKKIMYSWDIDNVLASQKLMDSFFERLIYSGWNRERIYNFTFLYIKNNLSDLDYNEIYEAAFDYLGDIESSIIGHCSYDSFLMFPDEPQNKDELIAYVRGEKWKS
ncbi:hypothetical protein GZ449_000985 [Salmonella enterica]|nr:hypothetical protein [Salmonella enterica]EDT6777684.1 hypothetical protein [Salmonella enterica subsp. enterica]EEI3887306.1 hypothetical protein [Salmonella enterica]EIQ3692403.1 hypothetical protein [Salmonella enterica]EJQ0648032.1 hypothetical protein [Salmonella enterica]